MGADIVVATVLSLPRLPYTVDKHGHSKTVPTTLRIGNDRVGDVVGRGNWLKVGSRVDEGKRGAR